MLVVLVVVNVIVIIVVVLLVLFWFNFPVICCFWCVVSACVCSQT